MRILFLLPSVPEPPVSGARIRNLGLLRLAGAEHEVDALAFGETNELEALRSVANDVEVVPPPRRRSAIQRAVSIARTGLPDIAERLWSPAFRDRLCACLASRDYDVVQAEGIEMARYLADVQPRDGDGRPWRVYDAHNAEFLLQARAATSARQRRALAAAAYSTLQANRLRRFEGRVVEQGRLTLAVSYHDANQLVALAPTVARTHVVPNGVDVSRYPFREPQPADERAVLFLGKLDYRPNAEALAWFVQDVLPGLFERDPAARLFVVGHNPPRWLVELGQRDARVAVVGGVPDERPYLERASALILPLRVGGGSRLKALVAFASGVPIVSTGTGMEGIEAEPGRDYLRAELPHEWTTALGALLRDVDMRKRVAIRGRELVSSTYDWQAIGPALRAAYDRVGAE